MEIITNQIRLTKKQYFNIVLVNWITTRWWTLVVICCAAFLLESEVGFFFKIFSFFYPITVIVYLWQYVKNKQNQAFFTERQYKINASSLYGETKENETGTVNFNTVVRVKRRKNYYLVYLSKTQFYYFPIKAFKCQEDAEKFDEILKERSLLK